MKMLFIGLCLIATSALSLVLHAVEQPSPQKTVIILLGPPGSGKGLQAMRLSKELGIPHISTGEIFRENIRNQTELGRKAKAYIDAGKLVPDDVTLQMLFDRVSQPDSSKGYVLDGVPRTVQQAEAIEKYLGNSAKVIILNLNVSDAVIMKRIEGRAASGQQRPDDKPEVVKERLHVYYQQTAPVKDYYAKKGLLININGEKSPDEVYQEIIKKIKTDTP